jgi:hypothetical protein
MPRMTTNDQAIPTQSQPTKPCHDCPFARDAINGWLGTMSIDEWIAAVRGESRIDCHALEGPQCAGAAIYRANICKRPRDRSLLALAADRTRVFANAVEFREHHSKPPQPQAKRPPTLKDDAKTAVLELLDGLIAPDRMSEEDAFSVLTDLQDDVNARAAALDDQISSRADTPRSKGPKR